MFTRQQILIPVVVVSAFAGLSLLCLQSDSVLDTSATWSLPDSAEKFPGGVASVRDTGPRAFGRSPMNIDMASRWGPFINGKSVFDRHWIRDVKGPSPLGPQFSSFSCEGCHEKDGRGHPPFASDERPQSMIVRLSRPNRSQNEPDPTYGAQLDYRAIGNATPEGTVHVDYHNVRQYFADGSAAVLHSPELRFSNLLYGAVDEATLVSARVAPATYGLGLLAAVPEADILAREDPDDRNGDGISGRANHVVELATGRRRMGRFGWKAAQPTIRQQLAAAFLNDMGITSGLYPGSAHGGSVPELAEEDLNRLEYYIMLVAVPNRRSFNDPVARHGQAVFDGIGCASCHTRALLTGTVDGYPEISNQRIFPYTDLLLHDMGEGLSDGFPEGEATGREWRTPPLWGIGLIPNVNRHSRLLHDGRARSIEEAILWHGGEAEFAAGRYRTLSPADRHAVIAFLRSI